MANRKQDDDKEIKDGVRVPMIAMDSRTEILSDGKPAGLHKPGYRYTVTDEAAETRKREAYDEYNQEISERYKSDAEPPFTSEPSPILDSSFDDEENCYDAYNREIENQWRTKE